MPRVIYLPSSGLCGGRSCGVIPQTHDALAPLFAMKKQPPSRPPVSAIHFVTIRSPLGYLLAAGTERGVCAVQIGDDRGVMEDEFLAEYPAAMPVPAGHILRQWAQEIVATMQEPLRGANVPVDMQGTPFQQVVWQALCEIPPGKTLSYKQLAHRIGRPAAVRAVARGCAMNPVAIVVPCHRVIGSNGRLTGYRWGLSRKEKLLNVEKNLFPIPDSANVSPVKRASRPFSRRRRS